MCFYLFYLFGVDFAPFLCDFVHFRLLLGHLLPNICTLGLPFTLSSSYYLFCTVGSFQPGILGRTFDPDCMEPDHFIGLLFHGLLDCASKYACTLCTLNYIINLFKSENL